MWSSFITLLIVSINLCTIIHSYKIANAEISKSLIGAYDEQDFAPRDDKYDSSEESSELQSTGRVVIGKWRNNGGALEPKWRDGDSVPLAPFSSISFRNGWEKDRDSIEDYHAETVLTSIEEKRNKNISDAAFLRMKNEPNDKRLNDNNARKNVEGGENSDGFENKPGVRRLSSSFIYRDDRNVNKNSKSEVKHRETLDNYPMEYELFESEENEPKPRKRRPPESYEIISGPWSIGNEGKSRADNNPARNVTTKSDDNFELKKYLRMQNGELSLSEILQEKNLTLSDILKGKANAISILKSDSKRPKSIDKENEEMVRKDDFDFERNSTNGGEKNTRMLPRRKIEIVKIDGGSNFNGEIDSVPSNYSIYDKDKIISTKVNESLNINISFEGNKFRDSEDSFEKGFENRGVLTASEKRDKNNSEVSIEKEYDRDEIMEFSDYPVKMSKLVVPFYETAIRSKLDEIKKPPSAIRETDIDETNSGSISKSDSVNTSKMVNEIIPKIVNEKSEDIDRDSRSEVKVLGETFEEEPSEKPDDMEIIPNEEGAYSTKDTREYSKDDSKLSNDKNQTLNNKLRDVVIPKVDPQSRAEILELFSSGSSAERLERLLASRNMSIEELIALRQRGSSQVHFAQVYEAKGQKETPEENTRLDQAVNKKEDYTIIQESNTTEEKSEKKIGDSEDESKENFESNLKVKNNNNNNNNDNKKEEDIFKADREYVATDLLDLFSRGDDNMNNYSKISMNNNSDDKIKSEIKDGKKFLTNKLDRAMNFGDSREAENVQKDSDGSSYYTSIETVKLPVKEDDKTKGIIDGKLSGETGLVEEIFRNDLVTVNKDYNYSENNKGLSKVRPSIIASGGILGVTIVVFLSIFIACRIRQKKKFNYKNSLAKTVFNNPVMAARKLSHTSSINSIMIEIAATSTAKRAEKRDAYDSDEFEPKSDIDNDSLNANDSWETIPDFMK